MQSAAAMFIVMCRDLVMQLYSMICSWPERSSGQRVEKDSIVQVVRHMVIMVTNHNLVSRRLHLYTPASRADTQESYQVRESRAFMVQPVRES